MQQQRIKDQITAQRSILQKQKDEAEGRLQTMRVALITVIAVVIVGLTIYGMIRIVNSFAPPKEAVRNFKDENIAETEIKVLNVG